MAAAAGSCFGGGGGNSLLLFIMQSMRESGGDDDDDDDGKIKFISAFKNLFSALKRKLMMFWWWRRSRKVVKDGHPPHHHSLKVKEEEKEARLEQDHHHHHLLERIMMKKTDKRLDLESITLSAGLLVWNPSLDPLSPTMAWREGALDLLAWLGERREKVLILCLVSGPIQESQLQVGLSLSNTCVSFRIFLMPPIKQSSIPQK